MQNKPVPEGTKGRRGFVQGAQQALPYEIIAPAMRLRSQA